MTDEQKRRYEAMKKLAEEELAHLDSALSDEVTRARQKIEELQKAKKVVKQIYDSVCDLLGVQDRSESKDRGFVNEEKQA